jgi:dTDP-4-amino-4,6-dideoxy-D-galactose acyltransferase
MNLTPSSASRVERLDWDSNFFGFGVGSFSGMPATSSTLTDLLDAAFQDDFKLIYWFSNSDGDHSHPLAAANNGRFVDLKCIYEKHIVASPEAHITSGDIVGLSNEDKAQLRKLALQSGNLSRFKVDPRIPDAKWRALYHQWIDRSVMGIMSDAVLVARDDGQLSGMITLARNHVTSAGSIGLFAVDESARGKGLGKLLLRGAEEWFAMAGCTKITVATQGDNDGAKAIYQGAGFRLASVSRVYHFWRP